MLVMAVQFANRLLQTCLLQKLNWRKCKKIWLKKNFCHCHYT